MHRCGRDPGDGLPRAAERVRLLGAHRGVSALALFCYLLFSGPAYGTVNSAIAESAAHLICSIGAPCQGFEPRARSPLRTDLLGTTKRGFNKCLQKK